MEKKAAHMLRRIRGVKGLSLEEKLLFARSLAATPDERWQMHENFLRSHGLFKHSERKRFGFPKDLAHLPLLEQTMKLRKAIGAKRD